ncbi:MAG: trypsin-like peptidase domain-containing protein [Victivallales bacterium]|nr:trypsin-like peptidase domain-containing protein [Victivallales bacterium]
MKKLLNALLVCSAMMFYCSAAEVKDGPALAAALQVEDAFAQVVELAKPAVVVITNKQKPSQMAMQMERVPEEFYRFFGIPFDQERNNGRRGRNSARKMKPRVAGKGSGIIIREDGYILTNYHVIKDADALEVKTEDGTVYDNYKKKESVIVVGYDEESDLAVLRIPAKKEGKHAKLDFADSDKLRVGQWAIAIGAPFDLDYSVTIGCISQKGRTNMGMSPFDSYIQTDASINPGNSGGPLLDIRGRIIGVNQFIMTGGMSKGSIGLGFAISSNFAKQVANELIENGTVNRPFIGITMQDIKEGIRDQYGIEHGVLVREVIEGEAAEKAGVKPGDIITEVGGVAVRDSHELLLAVTRFKPGDKIKLDIVREGKKLSINVKAGNRSEYIANDEGGTNNEGGRPGSALKRLGLRLSEQDGEVIVNEVLDGGAADAAEDDNEDAIQAGDIIIDVNRKPVSSIADVKNALEKAKDGKVVLYLQRNGRRGGRNYRYFYALNLNSK